MLLALDPLSLLVRIRLAVRILGCRQRAVCCFLALPMTSLNCSDLLHGMSLINALVFLFSFMYTMFVINHLLVVRALVHLAYQVFHTDFSNLVDKLSPLLLPHSATEFGVFCCILCSFRYSHIVILKIAALVFGYICDLKITVVQKEICS